MQRLSAFALEYHFPIGRFHFGQPFCGSVYTRNAMGQNAWARIGCFFGRGSAPAREPDGVASNGPPGRYAGALGLGR
jgi:hypothetical protein